MDLHRLSLNQITTERWTLRQAIEGCRHHGVPWISIWRDKLAEVPFAEAASMLADAGLRVSGLCRGGMFPAATAAERQQRIDDNMRAIDEAAAIHSNTLVLVCGGVVGKDIEGSRTMVAEGIAAVEGHARKSHVRLAIEPLHPMFAADRSVIVTLGEANRLALQFDAATVGLAIDAFHVWWDPELYVQIQRSAGRVFALHISDWLVPLPDVLLGRGMMGDGIIEIRRIVEAVNATGYDGPVEVEIFNRAIWEQDGDLTIRTMVERYVDLMQEPLS